MEVVNEDDGDLAALACYQPDEVGELYGVERAGDAEIGGDLGAILVECSLEGRVLRVILGRAAGDLGQRDFTVAETRQAFLDQLVRGKLGGNVDYRVPVCRELVGLLECQCCLALARGGPDLILLRLN